MTIKERDDGPRGHGTKVAVEDYPFQSLDVPREGCQVVAPYRSLEAKFYGMVTPFGTSVPELVRVDGVGLLASKCGYCNEYFSKNNGKCRCHNGPTPNIDDWYKPLDLENDARKSKGLK